MRMVVQRVSEARVVVDNFVVGSIGSGLLVLVAVSRDDTEADAEYLVDRLAGIRIFPDEQGRMNVNIRDAGGALLIVSQFTLFGDCHSGRRPGFDRAAGARRASELYDYFVSCARNTGLPVATGVFQAHMQVSLINDGPVTIYCDSEQR